MFVSATGVSGNMRNAEASCDADDGSWSTDRYTDGRLSISGAISPQSLGRELVCRGWMTANELRNLLKSNFMEDAI
jgi:hypothetical protein